MKTRLTFIFLLISTIMATAQTTVYLSANGRTRSVSLSDNSATEALKILLKDGPIHISMHDYGGFEKVGSLPQSLPTADTRITTVPGDIMLYQGNQMVIFYGSNTWSYTRLGRIDNASAADIKEFLGSGNVEVTVSLTGNSGIGETRTDATTTETVYDLNGRIVNQRPLAPGIYIINSTKTIVR